MDEPALITAACKGDLDLFNQLVLATGYGLSPGIS
jgi:hypothetical protein